MKPLDMLLAALALLALAVFLGVLIWKVPEPVLIVVCAIGVLLAAFDFLRDAFGGRRRSRDLHSKGRP